MENNKVIGIHKGASNVFEFNKGIFFKEPIYEFKIQIYSEEKKKKEVEEIKRKEIEKKKIEKLKKEQNTKNNKNCIEIKLRVNYIKTIYFLDNTKLHNNLKELNDSNVELYINGSKQKYQKFFKPSNEGDFLIRLEFKTKLKDCSCMFYDCDNIIDIDFSQFNTENVIYMNSMFAGCNWLTSIDLSSFNTENLVSMENIFSYCYSIESVNLSSFSGESLLYFDKMFKESSSYITIIINKKFYEKIKSEMLKRYEIIFV